MIIELQGKNAPGTESVNAVANAGPDFFPPEAAGSSDITRFDRFLFLSFGSASLQALVCISRLARAQAAAFS
jgi:hypothetical protein